MSKSLVKKALDLCKDDEDFISKKKFSKVSTKSKKIQKKNKKSDDLEIFNKKGKNSKSLIEKYTQKNNKSNLDANLSYLKKISKPVVKYELIRQAMEKPSSKPKAKLEKTNDSVFTDEDFKKFEKSYFNKG